MFVHALEFVQLSRGETYYNTFLRRSSSTGRYCLLSTLHSWREGDMHGSAVFLKTLLVLINKTVCQSVDEQYCIL